ncbi:hypothetical protein R1sor_025043 [Riccia sorocarpa]|uniref:Protein kinase domain-containing protein n=1 Tax=Riccia sorocarpa TaxID=122646 RepID=A0ABD3GAJ5_9MARC
MEVIEGDALPIKVHGLLRLRLGLRGGYRERMLQNNSLTGMVPPGIWTSFPSPLEIYLASNKFTGVDLTKWCENLVSRNWNYSGPQQNVSLVHNEIRTVILPTLLRKSQLNAITDPNRLHIVSTEFCYYSPVFTGRYLISFLFIGIDFAFGWVASFDGTAAKVSNCTGLEGIPGAVHVRIKLRRAKALQDIQEALKKEGVKPPFFTYGELKDATGNFSEENTLGKGGFGAVYKAVHKEGILAVKLLFRAEQNIHEFLNEYAKNKNLAESLWGPVHEHHPLTWPQRLKICLDVARGLSYLHEELQPKILHRDIKPQNILLDKGWNAKIADFGLARPVNDDDITQMATKILGTRGYYSPEYATLGILSEKLDVYSYGVVVLEIISGRRCIDFSRPADEIYLRAWAMKLYTQDRLEDVAERYLLENGTPKDEIVAVLKMGLSCLQENPAKRPSMSQLVHILAGSSADLAFDIVDELRDHQRVTMLQNVMNTPSTSSIGGREAPAEREDRALLNSNPSYDAQRAIEMSLTLPR